MRNKKEEKEPSHHKFSRSYLISIKEKRRERERERERENEMSEEKKT